MILLLPKIQGMVLLRREQVRLLLNNSYRLESKKLETKI